MAGEYGRRSKSRCMTPCLLNSIIYVSSHVSVEQLPKEKPSQDCEGFALKEIRSRKRGEHKTSPSRCSCSKYRRFEHSERTWSCAVSQSESSGYSLMHRNSSTPSRPWICSTRTGCRRIAYPRILRLPRAEKPCRSSPRGHRPSYRQRYRLSL